MSLGVWFTEYYTCYRSHWATYGSQLSQRETKRLSVVVAGMHDGTSGVGSRRTEQSLRNSTSDHRNLRHRLSGRAPEDPPKDKAGNLLLAGAAAGGVSKFFTAPIDRVKLMYQVSPDRIFSITEGLRTVRTIVNTSGVSGLWRGNSVAILRDVPYAAIIFSSYAMLEESFCGCLERRSDVWSRSAAGCAAGALATCLTCRDTGACNP